MHEPILTWKYLKDSVNTYIISVNEQHQLGNRFHTNNSCFYNYLMYFILFFIYGRYNSFTANAFKNFTYFTYDLPITLANCNVKLCKLTSVPMSSLMTMLLICSSNCARECNVAVALAMFSMHLLRSHASNSCNHHMDTNRNISHCL